MQDALVPILGVIAVIGFIAGSVIARHSRRSITAKRARTSSTRSATW